MRVDIPSLKCGKPHSRFSAFGGPVLPHAIFKKNPVTSVFQLVFPLPSLPVFGLFSTQTDPITALPQTPQWPPVSLGKSQHPYRGYKAFLFPWPLWDVRSLPLFLTILPLSLDHFKHVPTSGPLPLLCPLPERAFPRLLSTAFSDHVFKICSAPNPLIVLSLFYCSSYYRSSEKKRLILNYFFHTRSPHTLEYKVHSKPSVTFCQVNDGAGKLEWMGRREMRGRMSPNALRECTSWNYHWTYGMSKCS